IAEMAVAETVMLFDRVPLGAEILEGALLRLGAACRTRHVRENDGAMRRVACRRGNLVEGIDVGFALAPLVLHDHEHAETEFGHDFCRLRAHRGCVETPLGMRDRPRADRRAGYLVKFAVELERRLAERADHDLRGFREAAARLAHRNAETLV